LALAAELEDEACTAVAVTPGWMRSEQMLENFGMTEETWRDALAQVPHFCISETPTYVARGIVALAGRSNRTTSVRRAVALERGLGAQLRRDGHRWNATGLLALCRRGGGPRLARN
jgi:hypothetical protein